MFCSSSTVSRIINDIVNHLYGLHIPQAPEARADIGDLSRYEGTYRHLTFLNHVRAEGDRLTVRTEAHSTSTTTLIPLDETTFTTHTAGSDMPYKAAFLMPDDEARPACFHIGGRVFRREE